MAGYFESIPRMAHNIRVFKLPAVAYLKIHIMRQTLFVKNNNIISIITNLSYRNFSCMKYYFVVRNLSRFFGYVSHVPSLWIKTQMKFPLQSWYWELVLWCYPLKKMRFQQLLPSPDYNTTSPLSCETLGVLMVQRLRYPRGLFMYPLTPPP